MANSNNSSVCSGSNVFREAVCINTRRIYDSCGDKDCIRDLHVFFTNIGQATIESANNIKVRSAEVVGVYFEVEPVAFNKGFYTIDITYYFKVTVAAYTTAGSPPSLVEGLGTFTKKVILFGSDASVRTFSTEDAAATGAGNLPIVNVQVIEPMILGHCVNDCQFNTVVNSFAPPAAIAEMFDGSFAGFVEHRALCVTLGLFTIVQLERQVQIMVPIYDFCIPEKCAAVSSSDDPCEMFGKIAFPTDEFFPPRLADLCDD